MGQQNFFMAFCAIVSGMHINAQNSLKNYGIITSPVVDLYNSAAAQSMPPSSYPLPAMTRNYDYTFCARINQALFNETFEITHQGPETSSIVIPWAVYDYDKSGKPLNTYWIKTKDILRLNKLAEHKELLQAIPHFASQDDIILLKRPFTDSAGITYSVGTEFVCTQKQPSRDFYTVMYLRDTAKSLHTLQIPHKLAFKRKKQPLAQARKEFVKLLTQFVSDIAHNDPYNAIAYVWGGNSFLWAYTNKFIENKTGFHRTEHKDRPLCGYDCSLLVLRFAHMAGVPYYFKTTSMLEKYGRKFLDSDALEEGDLIWFKGHVVVITDLKNCLVTEAAGYENFVGKCQTIPLCKLIRNINTWDDLIKAYKEQRVVTRLDAHGNTFKESPVKIFKLL
jgi:hypothetical protein